MILSRTPTWFAILLLGGLLALPVWAIEWPQEVRTSKGPVVVYQPQPESLDGNQLQARAAMSFSGDGDQAIFGVFWFRARIDTDRSADRVTVHHLEVTNVKWADSKDASEQLFIAEVGKALEGAQFDTSLSQLTASLESAEQAEKSLDNLNNDPPVIVFRQQLAVLLSFDGDPRFSAIDNSHYERALNTPMTVVRDTTTQAVYLTSGNFWYQAKQAAGPYQLIQQPPAQLQALVPAVDDDETSGSGSPPQVVVATEPTELIASDGPPQWQSLAQGALMYVNNTETPWLRELATNNMYVLLSGRWYRAKSERGPWTFVRADELPQSFSLIPPDSDIGGLRVSVAGTEEAQEAVLDAQVPQTAAINRKTTSLTVEYADTPKFQSIPGTGVDYAINTGAQVLRIGGVYYAVDNGVWFTASAATGPWQVADDIPKQAIAKIPPSSPMYNVTYVNVYQSTPEVVYVGYTPGYLWSYPYYGVPVYGTGWHYRPYWHGGYYYPRTPTWGFNVNYNNWSGWTFGVSWSNGFFNYGMNWNAGWHGHHHPPSHCCSGWYGGGYRRPVVINTGDINIGNKVNIGNKIGNKINLGNRASLDHQRINNLYKNANNKNRLASKQQVQRDFQKAKAQLGKANNVYADRNGQVFKNQNGEWKQRANNAWQGLSTEQQQQLKARASQVDREQLKQRVQQVDQNKLKERLQQVDRQAAQQRVQQYQQAHPGSREQLQQRLQNRPSNHMQQLNAAQKARQQGLQRQQMRQIHPKQMHPKQMRQPHPHQ